MECQSADNCMSLERAVCERLPEQSEEEKAHMVLLSHVSSSPPNTEQHSYSLLTHQGLLQNAMSVHNGVWRDNTGAFERWKSTLIVPCYQGRLNTGPTTQHSITQNQSRRKVIAREHCNSALGVIRAKICSNKEGIQHPQRPLFMFHLSATCVGGGRKAKLNSEGKRKDFSLGNLALLTSAVMLLGDNEAGQGWSHVSWVTVLNCIQTFYLQRPESKRPQLYLKNEYMCTISDLTGCRYSPCNTINVVLSLSM